MFGQAKFFVLPSISTCWSSIMLQPWGTKIDAMIESVPSNMLREVKKKDRTNTIQCKKGWTGKTTEVQKET